MTDSVNIWLGNEQITESAGFWLSKTLYNRSLTIALTGELGAGKTTCVRGLLAGLGITERVTSPTFALEQRYTAKDGTAVLHLDLYRLEQPRARELLSSSEDFHGIRCVEWPERAGNLQADMEISLKEEREGRLLTIRFDAIAIPDTETIRKWRNDVLLPEHIIRHCDAVADLCDKLGTCLLQQGRPIRPQVLRASAELHDLLRFIDFGEGTPVTKTQTDARTLACWHAWKQRFSGLRHEEACAAFLHEEGFGALGDIIAVHGLRLPPPERATTEQKLLFYADKRMNVDATVSLDERFEDFCVRYSGGAWTEHGKIWLQEAKGIEQELFPDGPPA